jgi:hypothetical protein
MHYSIVEILQVFFTGNLPKLIGSLDEAQFFQVIIQLMGCKRCSKICLFLYTIEDKHSVSFQSKLEHLLVIQH